MSYSPSSKSLKKELPASIAAFSSTPNRRYRIVVVTFLCPNAIEIEESGTLER